MQAEKEDLMAKTEEEDDIADEIMRKKNERMEKERNERLTKLKDYKVMFLFLHDSISHSFIEVYHETLKDIA